MIVTTWYCTNCKNEVATKHPETWVELSCPVCDTTYTLARNDAPTGPSDGCYTGTLDWSLLDWEFLRDMIRVMHHALHKYSKGEWKAVDIEKFKNSACNHLSRIIDGDLIDEESGMPASVHLGCNAMMLRWHERQQTEEINEAT